MPWPPPVARIFICVDGSDIVTETCRICDMVKKSGMLVKVYETHTGVKAPRCVCPDCTM